MSKEAAKAFIDQASKDEKIRDEVRKNAADVVGIGKKHGHEFTHDEFGQAMKDKWSHGDHPDFTFTGICFNG